MTTKWEKKKDPAFFSIFAIDKQSFFILNKENFKPFIWFLNKDLSIRRLLLGGTGQAIRNTDLTQLHSTGSIKVSKWKSLGHVRLFVTQWTIQSMEFSRWEYWSGQPFPSPGDLPNPGIEPRSPTLQADSLLAEPQGKPKSTGVNSLALQQ